MGTKVTARFREKNLVALILATMSLKSWFRDFGENYSKDLLEIAYVNR